MKLFTSEQIRKADVYTIEHEPISGIDLMERAATNTFNFIIDNFENNTNYKILAGPGNNGGDGLVIARLLADKDINTEVFIIKFTDKYSDDFSTNLERLKEQNKIKITEITLAAQLPKFEKQDIIIDAIFGSGLSRPIEGFIADIIHNLNKLSNTIISIDIPSGLFGEDNSKNIYENIIIADQTISFQFPKISFLLPENSKYLGKIKIIPIGIHPEYIAKTETNYFYTLKNNIKLKTRKKYDHKGNYGHALLFAGGYGKSGAGILSCKACLRSGVGLLSAFIPKSSYHIFQTVTPETMVYTYDDVKNTAEIPDLSAFNAMGIGPGIGTNRLSLAIISELIQKYNKAMVIDADALNILAENKHLFKHLPENTILTPHPGEFKRLTKDYKNDTEKLELLKNLAVENKVYVVLKGAHSIVATPNGEFYFNSTGNPGMATAGSGDVLTGVILALLAQNYSPKDAAIFGAFIHGLSGDIAKNKVGEISLIASDIIDNLPGAFFEI